MDSGNWYSLQCTKIELRHYSTNANVRKIGIIATIALAMIMIGSIGTGVAPPQYFGIVERFGVFAAVGFNAVLGLFLISGFRDISDK